MLPDRILVKDYKNFAVRKRHIEKIPAPDAVKQWPNGNQRSLPHGEER